MTEATRASIELTEEAAVQVRRFMAEEDLSEESVGLRVSVLPGGCSGFQYGLNLEDEPREDDEVLSSQGLNLYVDPFSSQYLRGTRIGWHASFQGSGFTFDNPNATGGCGCGTSFTA